jgi:hypothetical protein
MPQKRITHSSGLLGLAADDAVDERAEGTIRGAKHRHGDKAKPDAESDSEGVSDTAVLHKKSSRSNKTKGPTSKDRRRDKAKSNTEGEDGEDSDAVTKLQKSRSSKAEEPTHGTRGRRIYKATPDAESDEDAPDARTKHSQLVSSDKMRELERKLRDAKGWWCWKL